MKYFLIVMVLCIFPCLSNPAYAYVDRVIFVTSVQALYEGATSSPMTLQFQDQSGAKVKAGETMELDLTTTSTTGQFSSNVSSNVSIWRKDAVFLINGFFSSRTFYYKDNTPGNYLITARIRGKRSGLIWVAVQAITIEARSLGGPIVSVTVSEKESHVPLQTNLGTSSVQHTVRYGRGVKKPTLAIDAAPSALTAETPHSVPESLFARIWSFIKRLFF